MPPQEADGLLEPQQGKGWFTPVRLLWLFCAMNMLVYLDRGGLLSIRMQIPDIFIFYYIPDCCWELSLLPTFSGAV